MKKKLIIGSSICILIFAACLLLFVNKKKTDNDKEETASVSVDSTVETETEIVEPETVETEIIETETAEVYTGVDSEDDGDDTVYVLYLEDEEVRKNPIFDAFVHKEITAYDDVEDENRYIYEFFSDYPVVFGVHYMAEDLDGDYEDELLVFLQRSDTSGDLFVFSEVDGELYAWETWEDFLEMHMMDVEYYGNGVFSQGGGGGDIFGYYNTEGKIEYIIVYYRWTDGLGEDGGLFEGGRLKLYKEGIVEREYAYEGTYYWDDDSWEMTSEDQANKDECDAIINEVRSKLGKGKLIGGIEWDENAEKIPLEELLNKQ